VDASLENWRGEVTPLKGGTSPLQFSKDAEVRRTLTGQGPKFNSRGLPKNAPPQSGGHFWGPLPSGAQIELEELRRGSSTYGGGPLHALENWRGKVPPFRGAPLPLQFSKDVEDAFRAPSNPVGSLKRVTVGDPNLIRGVTKQAPPLSGGLVLGNSYIGSASSDRINARFRNHCIHGTGSNVRLQRAIQKYGLECFSFLILEYFPGFVHKEDLRQAHLKLLSRETYYIQTFNPEYNFLKIGGSSLGYSHNEDTKEKMQLNYSQAPAWSVPTMQARRDQIGEPRGHSTKGGGDPGVTPPKVEETPGNPSN
uniref:intron-encoded homing endonuclease n=1 Tax=Limnomonas spitsbergensis TaxID=2954232 RepID=UPI002551E51B